MPRRSPLGLALLLAVSAAAAAKSEAPASAHGNEQGAAGPRIRIVGIDGASWNAIDPMLARGELPQLAALIARGGAADLETVEPLTSPVVWTSIATGRSPAAHGITDFFSTRANLQVPTIYERLAADGQRVGLYDVLMSWPPAALPNGFSAPGWLRRDDSTYPVDALERASASAQAPIFRTDYRTRPASRDYLLQARAELAQKTASWLALERVFAPRIGVLTFYAVDAVSHRYWHGLEPEPFADVAVPMLARDEVDAVRDALLGIDRALGTLAGTLGPQDTLLLVSDHGFEADADNRLIWVPSFDASLGEAGLEPERDGFRVVSTFFAVTIRIAQGPLAARDRSIERLHALLDTWTTPEGEPLFRAATIDVAARPEGSERPWLERAKQWAVRSAAAWLFSVEPDPTAQAMIFALPKGDLLEALWPDGRVRVGKREMPVHEAFQRERFTGKHHPTAIFAAAGGPIARQSAWGRLSVLDVAPLVAYLAGAGIPDDLEGRLPREWIEPAYLAAHPPRRIPAAQLPGLGDDAAAAAETDDPELVEKLRALGYIE